MSHGRPKALPPTPERFAGSAESSSTWSIRIGRSPSGTEGIASTSIRRSTNGFVAWQEAKRAGSAIKYTRDFIRE